MTNAFLYKHNVQYILMLIIHIAIQSDAVFYFNIPRQFTWLYSIYYKCISIIFIFFPHHVKFEMFSLKSWKMPHTSHTKRNHVQITHHQTKPVYWALYCVLCAVCVYICMYVCLFGCVHMCAFACCIKTYEFYTGTGSRIWGLYLSKPDIRNNNDCLTNMITILLFISWKCKIRWCRIIKWICWFSRILDRSITYDTYGYICQMTEIGRCSAKGRLKEIKRLTNQKRAEQRILLSI